MTAAGYAFGDSDLAARDALEHTAARGSVANSAAR
jgi:hypothetical protein